MLFDAAILVLVALGVFFTFVGAVGLMRLPDVYTRAHAATKADTLGAGFTLVGVAMYYGVSRYALLTLMLLAFIYITNPTAAHAISRAAYDQGIEIWLREDGGGD